MEDEEKEVLRLQHQRRLKMIKGLELLELKAIHKTPHIKQFLRQSKAQSQLIPSKYQRLEGLTYKQGPNSEQLPLNIIKKSIKSKHRTKTRQKQENSPLPEQYYKSKSLIKSCQKLKPRIVNQKTINTLISKSHKDYNRLLYRDVERVKLRELMN